MSGPTNADGRAHDDQEIRAIVDRMFDAWGRGDAAAYHADLTDDADYVAFGGSRPIPQWSGLQVRARS
jgi:uncharacterized protein (TIGR02246 family)